MIRARRRTLGTLAAAGALLTALALSGCATTHSGQTPTSPNAADGPITSSEATDRGAAGAKQDPVAQAPAADVGALSVSRVQIPSIGVDAAVEPLERDTSGVLLPPVEWEDAGWYRAGVLPGQVGPAVIAGHLDTTLREAVFVHLKQLVAGDQVTVTMSDGSTAIYAVDRAIDVEKKTFPTEEVYGPTPDAQLRLITCNGPFDDAADTYANNYVVFASLVGTTP
ncbi:LPXTG-site transpeptidase (sortase) family protein [Plantibacter flavus]|uniref:LPXTG-site transpeptidase (Sortase) family protein n=1 Tax=Plantibacter flavus TaxID=150123 RepID=A0A3N2C043_9MICO|nr:sortase [Plantibacter flavus]ROR80851.1 LPXTG-site transpeptidase (sortase) family protein [Plantibacter flavus]SMG05608.1 LPXTG-site transpeptidase (sortase) family protein [Plantibacter flavus]